MPALNVQSGLRLVIVKASAVCFCEHLAWGFSKQGYFTYVRDMCRFERNYAELAAGKKRNSHKPAVEVHGILT